MEKPETCKRVRQKTHTSIVPLNKCVKVARGVEREGEKPSILERNLHDMAMEIWTISMYFQLRIVFRTWMLSKHQVVG